LVNEKDLYQRKMQAQIDEWKAELSKLRAQSSGASADAQMELNQQIKELEGKVEEGEKKLTELSEASEEAWVSIKDGFDSAWESLKSGVKEAASKFKS
jgi:predicted  nucleic acid-binding Zn-ribbon protein